MTEEEAKDYVRQQFGEHAMVRIVDFLDMVVAENGQQNLIAPSTVEHIWTRHALDSAQLMRWNQPGVWLDIGTGGGFPGMIIALLRHDPVILVEPRRRRATFLETCRRQLELDHVAVEARSVETVKTQARVISARAVASVDALIEKAAHCAREDTRWILPRGKSAPGGLCDYNAAMFHVEQSLTSIDSRILIFNGCPT